MFKWKEESQISLQNKSSICLSSLRKHVESCLGQKLGKSLVPNSQIVNAKFLKEIKGVIPVNTYMIREQNNPIVDKVKVLVVWREDQTSHNPKPNPEQGLNSPQFYRVWERWGSYRGKIWS